MNDLLNIIYKTWDIKILKNKNNQKRHIFTNKITKRNRGANKNNKKCKKENIKLTQKDLCDMMMINCREEDMRK